ncbi:Na+/H+ antiporter subunit D [Terribacillus saccharophilus]|uniref:Na+/H+ antiporter subunit D n=1 Tax=Terribacillus saccharophilus TaxID=361277 RepID=A0A268ACN4_9BACI|nr:Na+/H+ antiporter subunit D [Terribacillus saccharophilus]PAD21882.1 Na+/H+ antiporter subunit D [Terribacillus saccharophilus]PAF19617.1 Na+/H+ antiporter subunit D [Terribacillus saccharophilus]PAF21918.1 Na+/H+ antiporter subunit D [Terribacillus saccharophilus]PAF38915.1 Na+/H+ antiporter subunit D [Terribacillus saccharophilus]PAF40964.1 Na+/H+ antiporter subunit D [Terribacillus saccharophilus]
MTNLAILPILIPFLAGILLAFTHNRIQLTRRLAMVFALIHLIAMGFLLFKVLLDGSIVLEAGDWIAPYGIILVLDPLSTLLVLTSSIILLAVVWYAPASVSEEQEGFYFYTFVFLLVTGVSGAFVTGDLFNLFVFFEVLLMASYALITHGGKKVQLRESIKYVLINLFSSMLFVTAVSYIYAVLGTVNMAQLAERAAATDQPGIITTVAILLFFVFATKGAAFPLYYWMPHSYIVPNPVVSALFGALLTKVGVYSLIRTFTLIFHQQPEIIDQLFLWVGNLTMLFGVIGALASRNIKLIVAYNIIPAIGFMLVGIGIFNHDGLSGSIYYLLQDMIVKAALFLLAGTIAAVAGTADINKMGGMIRSHPVLGWMFFLAGLVLAGVPPFSGFIGKLLLVRGAFEKGETVTVIIMLLTSLLILLSIVRAFIRIFWGEGETATQQTRHSTRRLIPVGFLMLFTVFLGVGAEAILPTVQQIADYLLNPQEYIDLVLKGGR